MKNIRQKKIFIVLISVLMLCLIAGAITMLVLHQREEALEEQQNEALQELYDNEGRYDPQSIVLSNTTKPRAENLAETFGAELRITEDGSFAALTLPEGVTVFDIYENEEYRKYIEYMSLDYQAKISDLLASDGEDGEVSDEKLPIRPQYTVNDTDYNRQTYLDYLNMSNVWSKTKGSGITVAVIDTGIDTDHPEFAGRISEYSYNATEDKIVKDYVLSDGSLDWSLVEDEQGHGTAVAGVIAASMNGNGVVGIAPQVNIIVIKAECNEKGEFKRTSDLVFGLYYAIERDVAVVNMSFGTTDPTNPFAEPAQLAFDSDVICVAAAGNDASAALTYPAADENVFGVGALAEDSWELAAYSNYGENVDFVAPGTVYTTQMGGGYGGMDGTSFASPITAGVLALYMSQNKYSEFNTIEELLYASCYDLGDLGPDFYYGYGALDVSALMLEERGKVTFNMMTDELDNTEQVFIRSHTLQNMPEPERLYAIFDGWYYDPQCTDEYVWYEDEFHGDLTLYANWVNEDDGIPFTYVELEDGTIEIRSYTGHRRYITIPDHIDGKVVSSIGEEAFKGETRLREVKLPKYLKRIRRSAFSGCSNLVSMEIPDTVTEIGDSAFYDNVRLSTLIFGQNSQLESIGNYAFSGCAKMRTFTVPAKVTTLNATAFYRNTSMMAFDVQNGNTAFTAKDGVLFNYTGSTLVCYPAGLQGSYTVPENVKTVGDYAFAFTRLSSVELSNVETLGGAAFAYGSLESIVIPDSVISMGGSVFAYNGYLRSAKLSAGLTSISGGAFLSTALTSIEIPSGIRSIDAGAFANIGSLAEVTFTPNSTLTYIGIQAFMYSGVASVEIPESVVTIDAYAFAGSSLAALNFAGNSVLYAIGASAFEGQYQLTTVNLPDRLSQLGDYAFSGTGLTTVDIPASLTYFGAGAFASCHSLENIFVEDGNQNYVDVDGVVYNMDQTVLVEYPAGNERTSYNVLAGVTDIGEAAFYGSWNLRYTYFQEGLKHIRPYAFYNTRNIERINLPDSVEILDEYSFCGCGAKQYKLSQNLREIKAYALSKNARLTSIAIPDNVIQISNFAFVEDWNLRFVTFTENSKLPRISYGTFAYCGLTSFRVPANVSTMAQGAFMGCSNLQSFTFAKNSKLESISAYMFDGCSNLRTITFEKGSALMSIQAHGLEGMRKLTKIDFGDAKLTNIDNFAFRFCESLTRFDIPEGVTFLGRYAFYDCKKLSEVTVPSTMDFIGRFAFLGTKDINVYFAAETLPANLAEDWDHGTKGYYLGVTDVVTDGDWKYAKLTSGDIAIIEYTGTATDIDLTTLNLGGDIVNIGGGAFMDSSVERIVLPNTLQIIQAEAFYHSKLKSVSIPASVTFIGREAFAYTPIETLTFAPNAQVKTIEQSAFEKTEKLGNVTIPASVTTMGRAVFKSSGITSLTFANGFSMTEIPEEAFAYTHISAATIPDSVTVINHNAFREIKELKSVTLGNGAEMMIMSNVFYQSGLVTVYIPENVGYVGEYAFVGLSDLTEFTVSENNPYYKAVDGLLVSKNGRKLIAVPAGRTGSLTVPEGVEVIGFGAFEDSQLSEIRFLEGANILSFGYRAFYNADGITEMHIPASVVAIDYYAFAMCDNLQTVTFAENNNLKGVYEGAFYGCKNLSDIMLPDSIVEISDFAFYGCRKLTDVPVSETSEIKGIYEYAFAYAGFSGDYTTPETLIDIGPYAFKGNKFTSVTVPGTNHRALVIGIGAFADCNELEEITVPFIGASFEDNKITWFGYVFGAGGHKANATYVPKSLKKVNISEGITFVGEFAFDGLKGLEEMSIPHSVALLHLHAFNGTTARYELSNTITCISYDRYCFGTGISGHLKLADSVTRIGDSAFRNCSGLTRIEFGESSQLTSIGDSAFRNCSSLTSIEIPDSVTSIGDSAFSGCSSLTNIEFGGSSQLTSIGKQAFYGCNSLTIIKIPASVTSIGSEAFFGCGNLTSIKFGESSQLTRIDDSAFRNCSGLTRIEFGESSQLTSIGDSAFYNCSSLTSIKIPASVTSIGNSAFCNCSSLTSIEIPDSVTSIGSEAFFGCGNLTSIKFGESSQLTSIDDFAFRNCSNLTGIEIPDSVTSIGNSAFSDCSSLTSIKIPASVTRIGSYAFHHCSSLTSVYITDIAAWCGIDFGYSLLKNGASLYLNNELVTELAIPDSVTHINSYAFSGCSSLTSIEFGENSQLTSIGNAAFRNCSSLTSIEFGGSSQLTGIGDLTFYNCSSLTSIEIPDSVTSIGDSAFRNCSSLTSMEFGGSSQLTGIGSYAFAGCSNLTGIEIPDSVTSIGDSAFSGCSSLTNIEFGGSSQLTGIGSYAFDGCSNLTGIEIPDSVTSIGKHAFSDCSSLTNIEFGESSQLTSIGTYAFDGCSNLTSIAIPKSMTSIGSYAFNGCISLYVVHNNSSLELKIGDYTHGYVAYNAKLIIDKVGNKTYKDGSSDFEYVDTAEGFRFLKENGKYQLIAYLGQNDTVTLPKDISGNSYEIYKMRGVRNVIIPDGMTTIGYYAFSDCISLASVKIPDSVTSIGDCAFVDCSSLTSVTISNSVKSIGVSAFYDCSSLTSITIPDSVKSIGASAFHGCSSLTSIEIPDSVTSIGEQAFSGCPNLQLTVTENNSNFKAIDGVLYDKNVTQLIFVPDSVTDLHIPKTVTNFSLMENKKIQKVTFEEGSVIRSIGNGAFSGCSNLTSVTIPASVTSIGSEAFSGCSNLTSITIPNSVTRIGSNAFYRCSGLTSVHITDIVAWCEIVFRDSPLKKGASLYLNNELVTEVALPDSVTSIGAYAFAGCSNLTSIEIPDSVTSIGKSAFSGCSNLTSIEIPDSVTSIGNFAFSGCSNLTSIEIPDSVTSIFERTFSGCSNLTSITISNSVTSIDSNAFSDCSNLTSITIPDSVTHIGSNAFSNCSSLTIIKIPDSVTSIGSSAFNNCGRLASIEFGENSRLTIIREQAFYGCNSLTSIEIPDSVTKIDSSAFNNCSSLMSLEFGENSQLTSIGKQAFFGCGNLTSIEFGENSQLTSIGKQAFYGCNSLTSIEIPDSVTSIDINAFRNCNSLTSIKIPASVTRIGSYAFLDCSSLTSVHITDIATWCGIDFGYSLLENGASLYLNNELVTELAIPDSVTHINSYAFSGCSSLTSIEFGGSSQLTSIGDAAFRNCSSLTIIKIPASVTSIGSEAFSGCSSLTSIGFGERSQLTGIGSYAFDGCSNLTGIEVPDSVTSIGEQAFSNCSILTSIEFGESSQLTGIGSYAFAGCSNLTGIEIPDSVTSIGKHAFSGCSSLTSIGFGERSQLTGIGSYAFDGCSNLTGIEIPDSVTSIGEQAFSNCSILTSIEFGESSQLTSIGYKAFSGCNGLTSITIPDNVTSIGYYAFNDCSSLYVVHNNSSLKLEIGSSAYGDVAYCAKLIIDKVGNKTYKDGSSDFEYVDTAEGFRFLKENGKYQLIAYLGQNDTVTLPKDISGNSYEIYKMRGVRNVIIPDGMTTIGYYAFSDCISLTSIEIPDSVTSIGDCAFHNCSSLTSVTISNSLTSIGDCAFAGCSSLTSVTISNSLTSIGDYVFAGCSSLTSIEIPDSVTSIGDCAFHNCSSLTSIEFGGSSQLTGIGSYAFDGCSNLTGIEIPDSVTSIGKDVFLNSAYYLDPNSWENGVLYIGNHLIRVSEETKYMDIRKGIVSIASNAYEKCYLLKKACGASNSGYLSSATNLETLVLTQMPSNSSIIYLFGSNSSNIPLTLKSIILDKDVLMRSNAFYGITGITIYVEANEKDVRWDENYPGWNNGNKVVYGDDWITVDFYDQNGDIMSNEIYLTSQVIRQPYLELAEGLEESQVLVGWDINGDGKPDTVPATSTVDIEAYPVIETRPTEYTVRFFDADGVTLISKVILPCGAVIVPPETEEKMGYTTSGWIGYTEGMTVSGNLTFVLDRVHDGDGHTYAASVWVAPTCTEQGYNKHICTTCGEWYATDHVEAKGHDYHSAVTESSCTEVGKIHYTCSACDHEYWEIVPAHGHNYIGTITQEATCTEYGEILYVCEYCGDRVTEFTPMKAHDYQKRMAPKWWLQILIERILNVFFGYEGDNIYYYECVDCKHIQTADESPNSNSDAAGIQSAGCVHQLSNWTEYIAPTCEGDGVDAKVCAICGKSVEYRRGSEALGHGYTVTMTDPTCTEKGYTTHTCHCGDTYVDSYVDALGHDAVQHSAKDANCTEIGWKAYETCSRCDYTTYAEIPAKGHAHQAVVTAPTCTEKGYTTHTCHCGDTYVDSYVDALGHDAVQHSAKDANCTEIGWKAYQTCSRCDYTTYVEIPAKGHAHQAVVTAPTCTEKGYTTHTCHCGDTYVDSYVDALGHDAVQHSAKDANCTEIGWKAYETCSRCDYTTYAEIPAKGHDHKAVVTAPTCTEKGYTTHTCHCGDTYVDSYVNALGHDTVQHSAKDTTCTEIGWKAYETCSRCDYTTYVEIPAKGHTTSDWVIDTEPAPGVEGSRHKECTECGETLETGVIEALPVETETETEVPTEAPTASNPNGSDTDPSGKGCSGVVLANSVGVILLAALCSVIAVRRREDEGC